MNRVIAVSATLATAATATMVAVATIVPAMAAPRPAAAHSVTHEKTTAHAKTSTQAKAAAQAKARAQAKAQAKATAQRAKLPVSPPTEIGSELDGRKYVTVVRCQGVDSPPPINLAKPGTPLIVSGVGPSAAILKMLQKPNPYKTIYTCTLVVRMKVAKPKKAHKTGCEIMTGGRKGCKTVTLNTGFGGLAHQVTGHHPAG
jgi:hypothetical protein